MGMTQHRATMEAPISFVVSLLLIVIPAVTGVGDSDVRFSYHGARGPGHWESLSPTFSACSSGKRQSPVNIVSNQTVISKACQPLDRHYNTANATVTNSGIVVGVRFGGNSGALQMDGKKYWFKQMHWHSPSEHQINGERLAAELHLVHQTEEKNFAVVAVLYRYGKRDTLVDSIRSQLQQLAKPKKCSAHNHMYQQLDISNFTTSYFKRNTSSYYKYFGSFTTPPCTENVTFYILSKVREMSKAQVDALEAPLCSDCKNNSRPVQPLNGRKIELCHVR